MCVGGVSEELGMLLWYNFGKVVVIWSRMSAVEVVNGQLNDRFYLFFYLLFLKIYLIFIF